MSSARKRSARQKAKNEVDGLHQQLRLEGHHNASLNAMATEIARRYDALRMAVVKYLADNDPTGFGCACAPNRVCGPCRAAQQQKPLQDAVKAGE